MLKLNVKGTEYNLKFGYRSFRRAGVLKEAVAMQRRMQEFGKKKKKPEEETAEEMEMLEEMFNLNSKLVLAALQKYHKEFRADYKNPESVSECEEKVDDLLDEYMDEEGAMDVGTMFAALLQELFSQGFLPRNGENPETKETNETDAATETEKNEN